ncbi:MAG: hypothetical protein IJ545_04725 [Alphaproteobacteria bacterium]|nr:hypothetical protein [Alphaproteobacteria bacterium]
MADLDNETPENDNPAENPATPENTDNKEQQTPQTPENPKNETPDDKDAGGLVYPDENDAEAVLAFRKACGYPDDASGYGLPMETDEQKNLANFLHSCQLDKIAAKNVAEKLQAQIEAEDKAEKEQYAAELQRVTGAWGENFKANESLVKRGAELMKINDDALRGISECIGVEAALSMLMLLGKTNTDYSGVSGGSSTDDEDVSGFIARKRGR